MWCFELVVLALALVVPALVLVVPALALFVPALEFAVPIAALVVGGLALSFVAVAAADHPLNQASSLTHEDLRQHRQIVIRDSGSRRIDSGWLGAEQRWTVSHPSTRIAAIRRGLGFAWVPEAEIGDGLESGALKELPLKEGGERLVDLYLIYADGQYAGQAARYLGERIRDAAAIPCPGVTVS